MFMMRRCAPAAMAKPVIVIMRADDKEYRHRQERVFIPGDKLLQHQKRKSKNKQRERAVIMMVPGKAVVQRIGSNE